MLSAVNENYKKNVRLIFIAAAVILGLWFAFEIINVIFLFFFAVVITLVLNRPTMWLISKNISRPDKIAVENRFRTKHSRIYHPEKTR